MREGIGFVITPSSKMYSDLREFGGITNRDAARTLISPTACYGDMLLSSRILDRPFLSTKIVHAKPGSLGASCFQDFGVSSQTLYARILKSLGDVDARERASAHYAGPAVQRMCSALAACGLDENIYTNTVRRIEAARLAAESDRGVLFLHLFIACGCLGDSAAAALSTERFIEGKLSAALSTQSASAANARCTRREPQGPRRVGLLRIIDGAAKPPLHVVSTAPEGTVIGSLANGAGDIADVDPSVSRRHLRVWREGGAWLARGLGSTNGSYLVSGETRERITIEPPKSERPADEDWPAVQISNSDMLCLGASTRFLVMALAD